MTSGGRRGRQFLLAVVGMAMLWPAGSALAVQGFGISPTQAEVTLAPGGTTKGTLTVINDGDTDVTYKVYAADYAVKGEDYEGIFSVPSGNSQLSVASWFGLPSGNFVIKARQEGTFDYTLMAPAGAAVGGHYGAVFIQTVPPPSSGAAIINRITRVASLFYITVSGALHQQGQVLPLDVAWLQSTPPVKADVKVENGGNDHFLVSGTASLSGFFGGKVGNGSQWRGEVLPGTTRDFSLALPEPQPIGIFKVSVAVSYLGHTMNESHWTVLIPKLTFIIVGTTVLVFLGFGFWGLMRRARRRK